MSKKPKTSEPRSCEYLTTTEHVCIDCGAPLIELTAMRCSHCAAKQFAEPLVRETETCIDCGAPLNEPGRVRCGPCRTIEDLTFQVKALEKRMETEHAATAAAARALEAERHSANILREEALEARAKYAARNEQARAWENKYRAKCERYVAMAVTFAEHEVREAGR